MGRFAVVGILLSLSSIALTGCSQEQAEAVSKSDFKSKPEQAAYEAALDAARAAIAAVRAEKEIIKAYQAAKAEAKVAQTEAMYAEKAYKKARTARVESYHGDLARDDPA